MKRSVASAVPARAESLEPRLLCRHPNTAIAVVGRVFEDLDGDGRWGRGEPPLAGVAIESFPQAGSKEVTDENGWFRVFRVWVFGVSVRVVPPEGLHPTPGDTGQRDAALPRHERTARVKVRPIPLTRTGGVAGSVFLDPDRNGLPGEYPDGAPGWRVFLDANGDGVRQRSERMDRTGRDGVWGFGGLGAGTHRVAIVQRRRFIITTPPSIFLEIVLAEGEVAADENLYGVARVN